MRRKINVKEFSSKIKKIFRSLDENEKFGLSFELFPVRLEKYGLTNSDFVDLIRISQRTTGVRY